MANNDVYINQLEAPLDSAAFDKIKTDNQIKIGTKNYILEVHEGQSAKNLLGYEPKQLLRGFVKNGVDIVNLHQERITFQQPGLFGQCSDISFIGFMIDQPTRHCSFPKKVMNQAFCEKTLSLEKLFNS